jgi:hypothetical protein
MFECAKCGEPLELPEMLSVEINEIGTDHICESCRLDQEDDQLMQRYWHG